MVTFAQHACEGGHPALFLDSRQKHAGMTPDDNGYLILWSSTKVELYIYECP